MSCALQSNDAWSPIPGGKHPQALGRPAVEVWPETWDEIGPLFAQVFSTGDATYLEDAPAGLSKRYRPALSHNLRFARVRLRNAGGASNRNFL